MKLITRLFSFLIRRSSRACHFRPDYGPDGYALIVMLIAVTVMTIALLAVLPSTFQEARREREEELLFRGNQYQEAIYLFQKKFNRYPSSVKELLHTDNLSFLRKPWPDPMTPNGKWRYIHASGTGAVLDSWMTGPALGAGPLGQNGQNGQNGLSGTNPQNGSTGGFGTGQSGSPGFGSSSTFGGPSSFNSGSSGFSLGGNSAGEAGSTPSPSQNDFGWPSSGTGSSSASADAGELGGSWDTASSSGLSATGTGLQGAPGSSAPGASDSINSLSPAALHAEEPGRPLDANGKPKMSPDCMGGNQQGNGSSSSSTSSIASSGSSSNSSSFTSSSSFGSSGSPGSPGFSGSPGSSGFSGSSGFLSSSSSGATGSNGGPLGTAIVGVASCSDQTSLRTYNKHHRYSEWEFIGVGYNPLGSGAMSLPQGTGQPGQQGQGQGSSFGFGSSGTTNQPGSTGAAGYQPNNPQPPTTPQPTPTPPSDQPEGP